MSGQDSGADAAGEKPLNRPSERTPKNHNPATVAAFCSESPSTALTRKTAPWLLTASYLVSAPVSPSLDRSNASAIGRVPSPFPTQ